MLKFNMSIAIKAIAIIIKIAGTIIMLTSYCFAHKKNHEHGDEKMICLTKRCNNKV